MRVVVLGSAAGGGVPQWNCNYQYSREARIEGSSVECRTQSSIAVCSDERKGWVLFNASPDIRQQISATSALHPDVAGPLRSTPIKAVVLTNADVDHLAGLLTLRERQAFWLYATRRVIDVIEANSIFRVLDRELVRFVEIAVDGSTEISGPDGPLGLVVESFAAPGKVALFLETGDASKDFATGEGDTLGVIVRPVDGVRKLAYLPGCAAVTNELRRRLATVDALLFDGTVYTDDEMAKAGVGQKSGQRMGHLHISGPDGSMAKLADLPAKTKMYVHINNTNPILDANSPERAAVEAGGWQVASDGLELVL